MAPALSVGQDVANPSVPDVPPLPRTGGTGGAAQPVGQWQHSPSKRCDRSRKARFMRRSSRHARTATPSASRKRPRRPLTERPGIDPPSTNCRMDRRVLGMGCRPQRLRMGDRHVAQCHLPADSGSTATGSGTTRGGIAYRDSGASGRPIGSITARTAPLKTVPTTNPAIRPTPTASTSPASTTRTATASSGKRATGPRPSPVGRGCPPVGSPAGRLGLSRRLLGSDPRGSRNPVHAGRSRQDRTRGRRPDLSALHQGFPRDVRAVERRVRPSQRQL